MRTLTKEGTSPCLAHSASIRLILKSKNHEHKYGSRDELGEELIGFPQELLRIGTEDARRGCRTWRHYSAKSAPVSITV